MAYDAVLVDRLREQLAGLPEVREKAMFGGLAFLVGGHMAVAASGQGGLMVRCDPAETDDLLADPAASRMVMRGRAMDGWLRIADDGIEADDALARWVACGVDYACSLPPK